MNYYWFYQECKDSLIIARINRDNCILFAVFFFYNKHLVNIIPILVCAKKKKLNIVIYMKKFKAFIFENCVDFKTFVKIFKIDLKKNSKY